VNERDVNKTSTPESKGLVRCMTCIHFSCFFNEKGHDSPHALGKCAGESWDGNKGQWGMFQHSCKDYASISAGKNP